MFYFFNSLRVLSQEGKKINVTLVCVAYKVVCNDKAISIVAYNGVSYYSNPITLC